MDDIFEITFQPGISHIHVGAPDGGASQYAWLRRACSLTERFAMIVVEPGPYDRMMATMVLYSTADFLFGRLGEEAARQPAAWIESAFEKLDPAAFIAMIVRSVPGEVGAFAEVLRDFYAFLVGAGEIDRARGQYLACYFDTLLELHGAGPTGILPTRASRRATATLARRITEARLRSEERANKKSAA